LAERLVAFSWPGANSLLGLAGVAVVTRDQLRAGRHRVGEFALKQFGDPAVILLAPAQQHRRSELKAGMLCCMACTWRPASQLFNYDSRHLNYLSI
jgi:hypothetical protein